MNSTAAKAGVSGGMIATMLATPDSHDIFKTVVLSTLGAGMSFITTFLLKQLLQRKDN